MRWQRQLHQYAVYRRIIIQPRHQRQQLALGRVHWQFMLKRVHADFRGLLALVSDINLAGRILAGQNNRAVPA